VTLADVKRVAERLFGDPRLLVQAVGRPVGLV
jgi:zinc protease